MPRLPVEIDLIPIGFVWLMKWMKLIGLFGFLAISFDLIIDLAVHPKLFDHGCLALVWGAVRDVFSLSWTLVLFNEFTVRYPSSITTFMCFALRSCRSCNTFATSPISWTASTLVRSAFAVSTLASKWCFDYLLGWMGCFERDLFAWEAMLDSGSSGAVHMWARGVLVSAFTMVGVLASRFCASHR